MGTEFRDKGTHIALGPVVGALGRSPFAGRNWEGLSPDAFSRACLLKRRYTASRALASKHARNITSASRGVIARTDIMLTSSANEQEIQRNPTVVDRHHYRRSQLQPRRQDDARDLPLALR